MKTALFKTVFIIGLVLLFFLNTPGVCQEEAATIIYLRGQVKVQHPGEDSWVLAEEGMILKDNDKIKTFADSEAEIALDPALKNIVKLETETEVVLQSLRTKKVYMPEGKVFSIIESLSPDSSFEVRTPTAVAGVAGSGLSVETDGKRTEAGCFEDKGYVMGIDRDGTLMEKVMMDEGFKRIIEQFEMPGKAFSLSVFEKIQWSQFKEDLRTHLDRFKEKSKETKTAAAPGGGTSPAAGAGAGEETAEGGIGGMQDRVEKIQEGQDKRQDNFKENIVDIRQPDKREDATRKTSDTTGRY